MKMKYATKVSGGLSGFFAPYIAENFVFTGAIGGGITVDRGVYLELSIDYHNSKNGVLVENYINNTKINNSCIAKYVTSRLLSEAGIDGIKIAINQRIDIPIGGGYGSSGASALAIALALANSLKLRKTIKQIAQIAHEADIICRTGLGTVVGLLNPCGGIVIVKKAGDPYHAEIDHIPVDSSITAISAFYNPIPKNNILNSNNNLEKIRRIGLEILNEILKDPSPETFIRKCYEFAVKSELITNWVNSIIKEVASIRGVLGASMNMIGEGIFMFIERNYVENVINVINRTKPKWIHIWSPMICTEFSIIKID